MTADHLTTVRRNGLWERLGQQLAEPRGAAGRLIGRLMVSLNRIPNRLAVAALSPQAGQEILEVGFGPGDGLAAVLRAAPGCRLSGIDHSSAMASLAHRRNRRIFRGNQPDLRTGSVADLPWANGTFEKILAVNVAYFFDPDGRAVGELRRVLKPGGCLVLYVTDRATMLRWRFAGEETHRTYDERDLRMMLTDGGFPADGLTLTAVNLPFSMRGWIAVARQG